MPYFWHADGVISTENAIYSIDGKVDFSVKNKANNNYLKKPGAGEFLKGEPFECKNINLNPDLMTNTCVMLALSELQGRHKPV